LINNCEIRTWIHPSVIKLWVEMNSTTSSSFSVSQESIFEFNEIVFERRKKIDVILSTWSTVLFGNDDMCYCILIIVFLFDFKTKRNPQIYLRTNDLLDNQREYRKFRCFALNKINDSQSFFFKFDKNLYFVVQFEGIST